jgi:hypothetical protein
MASVATAVVLILGGIEVTPVSNRRVVPDQGAAVLRCRSVEASASEPVTTPSTGHLDRPEESIC